MKSLIRFLLLVLPMAAACQAQVHSGMNRIPDYPEPSKPLRATNDSAAAQSKLPPCPSSGYKHNCFGSAVYASGAKYHGRFLNGEANGFGAIVLPSGSSYVGEWVNGFYHGRGIEYSAIGTISASGIWFQGRLSAPLLLDPSMFPLRPALVHQPEFDSSLNSATQSRLPSCPETAYKHNCLGTNQLSNGNKFVGEFKDGMYHGQGTYTFANGDKYVGEFKDGKRNGQGTFTFADGEKYVGEFKDDRPNGQGTYTYANGNKFVGEFKDNKYHGQGTKTLANGDEYVGEWKDDEPNGQGTLTFADGGKFVGDFKDGMYHGQGTFTFANGDKYVGEWKDGKYNGQGIEYRADGTIYRSGQWVSGDLAQSFAIDRSRFPFDLLSQAAVPPVDPSRAERDRLAAEAEAAKRRQQELEQRLATEAREREKQAAEVEAVRRRQQELEAQLAALQSQAASRPPNQAASSRNQRRVALVIGNAQYMVSPLHNPVNDATDMDRTLKQLGFQTTLLLNATLGQMREATRRFADQLQSADVALIYFAGHGVESNRKNYMIPVNADLKFEYELDDQAYNAGQWLDMLESIKSSNAERVNIVILDACRNNSLIGARSLGRGLGRMDAPTGTFLAYSTAPGKVAVDGARGERNSPFTRHLLTVMQQPGLPIEEAFKEVRRNVSRETNGAQVPWESTSLTGFFTFRQTR